MKFMAGFALAAAAAMFSAAGQAQEMSRGDMSAGGGVKLAAEQLKPLLAGATLRWSSVNTGQPCQFELKSDGSMAGSCFTAAGRPNRNLTTGSWRIADNGRWCRREIQKGFEGNEICREIWKRGEKYYFPQKADDQSPLHELTISK